MTQRPQSMVIDDLSKASPLAANGAKWGLFTDQVMGGVSRATMVREIIAGRTAIRMRGYVSLETRAVLCRSPWMSAQVASRSTARQPTKGLRPLAACRKPFGSALQE